MAQNLDAWFWSSVVIHVLTHLIYRPQFPHLQTEVTHSGLLAY